MRPQILRPIFHIVCSFAFQNLKKERKKAEEQMSKAKRFPKLRDLPSGS